MINFAIAAENRDFYGIKILGIVPGSYRGKHVVPVNLLMIVLARLDGSSHYLKNLAKYGILLSNPYHLFIIRISYWK
jgi:hypothetical protein